MALLNNIIDYAGLFPPAQLDMERVVENYATYLVGDDGWMLGRLLMPTARLDEFEKYAAKYLPADEDAEPWQISALTRPADDPNLPDDLQRIEQFEPSYNAFTFMNQDALEDARDIDRRRKNGEALGPLAGVPLVIKESMDIVGYPSTFGWTHTSAKSGGVELLPQKNATVVQRLIDADAIILGKTNIPAFSDSGTRAAASWAGPTYNAVNRKLAPGGSSSGTATAVAAGFAAAGLAEETGGSIQNPAAAQSLVGIVPTFSARMRT